MLDSLSLDRSLQWADGRQLTEMIFSTSSAWAIAATASKLLSPMTGSGSVCAGVRQHPISALVRDGSVDLYSAEQHPSQVTTSRDANT